MTLFYAQKNQKVKITKINDFKLKHLALQGAICYVLERYKSFVVVQFINRGKTAIDFNLAKLIEVEPC